MALKSTKDMKILRFVIPFFALMLNACSDRLHNGDLVFQINESSDFVDAIEAATNKPDLSFSHVGIVNVTDSGIYVIEANPKLGVVATGLNDFYNDSAHDKNGKPMVRFYRTKVTQDIADKAAARAASFIGSPYDFAFSRGTNELYCSELIYECFTDEDGKHIFKTQPMNFRDENGELPPYWTEHFNQLGIPIPENEEGTNPNDIAGSDKVELLRIKP